MRFAAAQLIQLFDRGGGGGVRGGADRQRDQHFIDVQARVAVPHVADLQALDGLDHGGRDQLEFIRNARQRFQRVQDCRGGCAQQVGGLAGYDSAVRQFDGGGGFAGLFRLGARGQHGGAGFGRDVQRMHQKLLLLHLARLGKAFAQRACGFKIAANDFILRCFAAYIVVHDGEARHIYAHVRGTFVRAIAIVNPFKHGAQHGEDFDITVVIHRQLVVGLQMEGVDHVYIVQVGGRGFVGDVHRMLQRQIPDGEGFKFRIARAHTVPVFVVQLGQAGGHLPAARSGRGDHHQRARGGNVIILAVAVLADDVGDVRWIIGDAVQAVYVQPQLLHALHEDFRGRLAGVLRQRDAAHEKPEIAEYVHQAHHIRIVGDIQIAALFVLFNIVRVDGDYDFRLILQF